MTAGRHSLFFDLVRSGLWEDTRDAAPRPRTPQVSVEDIDEAAATARDQAVTGLLVAGLEHMGKVSAPKTAQAPGPSPVMRRIGMLMGTVLTLEDRNSSMNDFIGGLMDRLRSEGVTALLVKGQGVARCYARPMWRNCGDVDLFLDPDNYRRARAILSGIADRVEKEDVAKMHQGMDISGWTVELHGTLKSGVTYQMDKGLLGLQEEMFADGAFRQWTWKDHVVLLPRQDYDILFVFCHILQHFFKGGIGLRQICDWTRLLWTFRSTVDTGVLESRLREMGIMSEWKVFAHIAVDYLGMDPGAMPFYVEDPGLARKAGRVVDRIMYTGNFGSKLDRSYMRRYPYLVRKAISFWRGVVSAWNCATVFPLDSFRFFFRFAYVGVRAVFRGI